MTDSDRSVDGEPADAPDPGDDVDLDSVPEFGDLTVLQRAFVAAAQNPSRGVLVVGLLLFALAFYAAFWLAFPLAAGLLSAVVLIVVAVAALAFRLADRASG